MVFIGRLFFFDYSVCPPGGAVPLRFAATPLTVICSKEIHGLLKKRVENGTMQA
jgi:hypothetical protein